MMELEFSFADSPWENYLNTLRPGDSASAATLLTMTQGQDEALLEELLQELEDRHISLSLEGLPKPAAAGQAAVRLRAEEQFVKKGMDPAALEPGDPLRLYLEELAGRPAFGDVQLLAEESRGGNDQSARQLTDLCLSSVVRLAARHVGMGVLLLDLIQEGSLGLWQAIGSWQSGDFLDYSTGLIRFYMARAVVLQAHASGVGQNLRTALEDYRSVDQRLLAELGRNPTLEELAEALHTTPEAVAAVAAMVENARTYAQAKQPPAPEEDELAQTQAVEDTAYFQLRQRVSELLSSLSPEDARLITLRYGLEGGLPLSPEDTGRRLGLTPDEVFAREAAALARLRTS